MKFLSFLGVAAFSIVNVIAANISPTSGEVSLLNCAGEVRSSTDGKQWEVIQPGAMLAEGMLLRTATNASADLLLQYNGSVFRLTSASELRVERLQKRDLGVDILTETRLHVLRGTLVGAQRKLHKPSVLSIATPNGEAVIRGTEYAVNASGAVSVISGSVEVTYNLPGNQGSVKVTVSAGYTFDPATQTVVPTTPAHLQNIIADIDTVKNNAEAYKAGGATVVVKPDGTMSPSTIKGNNGVGNGVDPQPPGNPPINDGLGTGPGDPGNKGK